MRFPRLNKSTCLIVSSILIGFVLGCSSREPDERFLQKTYVSPSGITLFYRLFVPNMSDPDSQYPLVMFLHGGRGTGTQLPGLNRWDYVTSDELSTYGELAIELIAELQNTYPIDRDRIYLTGQSLGSWGVWDLIAKRPDLFAAAIPVCGGGNPRAVSSMRDVSIWVFHGARDREVNVERSREMVKALRAVGSNVNYTEYRFSGHSIWDRAYFEDGLIDWLFAQRKQR